VLTYSYWGIYDFELRIFAVEYKFHSIKYISIDQNVGSYSSYHPHILEGVTCKFNVYKKEGTVCGISSCLKPLVISVPLSGKDDSSTINIGITVRSAPVSIFPRWIREMLNAGFITLTSM